MHNCGVLELEGVSLFLSLLYKQGTWLTQGHTNNESLVTPCPPPNTHKHRQTDTQTHLFAHFQLF